MGNPPARRGWFLALPLIVVAGTFVSATDETPRVFDVERLAEGVMVFRPVDRASPRTNSLVVERDDDLLVVEAQPTPEAARELLREIALRTPKPVRYLALSHAHAEAAGGASAFPDSAVIITTTGTATALADEQHDFGAEMRARDPENWVDPPRPRPDLVLLGRADLARGDLAVQLMPLSHSHSLGDLVVYLPKAEVLYAGGLIFSDRNPYAQGSHVGTWLNVLNYICSLSPRNVVGLRGPVIDIAAVRRQRDALAWVRGHVEHGFVDGLPLEGIEQQVLGTEGIEEHFDLDASPSFVTTVVRQVIEEAAQHRRKRGRL